MIANMVTISIRPYTARKVSFVSLALFCLSAFAQSTYTYINVHSTPYDRQMARIRPILASAAGHREQNLSFALVNHWIGDLRAIPSLFNGEVELFMRRKISSSVRRGFVGNRYKS
jgi:hypothetical protein